MSLKQWKKRGRISLVMGIVMLLVSFAMVLLMCSATTIEQNKLGLKKKEKLKKEDLQRQLKYLKKKSLKTLMSKNMLGVDHGVVYAERLSEAFVAAEAKHGVPAYLLAAIAFVESSYKHDAVNGVSKDYGIMQINHKTAKKYRFNKQKLLVDLHYNVDAGARVLKWFLNKYKLDEAIMRYNCGTARACIDGDVAKKYLRLVKKAM